jgi:Fe-S-cluster-containing hydrogenase component 2
VNDLYYPLRSLQEGHWFKLICGASYQHLPAIRNLALVYTLAGVDCIDVAADPAVILAAKAGMAAAQEWLERQKAIGSANGFEGHGAAPHSPWLMVSFNDGEDPHFRKAEFDARHCPPDCPRPCEPICPAQAIVFEPNTGFEATTSGVIADRCYGCGRCLPICPIQNITTRAYVSTPAAIAPLIWESGIDAIEIHTQVGRLADFQRLWAAISPGVAQLKLVAISCPDGDGLIDYLQALYAIMAPLPCALIWQTDGRPMSGDIGTGATRAAIKLGQKVLAAALPGFVQLAGGTNHHTVTKLRSLHLLQPPRHPNLPAKRPARPPATPPTNAYIAGVAYGSYARTLLAPVLERLAVLEQAPAISRDTPPTPHGLEDFPDLLAQGVKLAHTLISPLKSFLLSPMPIPLPIHPSVTVPDPPPPDDAPINIHAPTDARR